MNVAALQEKASASLYKGEYREAIALYEQCIEAFPEDLINYLHLGVATLLQGDEITAQTIWLSVLLQGNSEENDALLAVLVHIMTSAIASQIEDNNFRVAEKLCLQVLNFTRELPEVYYYMAVCMRQKDEINDAIAYIKQAIELAPNFYKAYCALGACLIDRGWDEYDEALNYLQKTIEFNPDYAPAYYNIGICLKDKGDFDEALTYLQKTIELNPNFAEAYYHMGICLKSKGFLEEAIEKLQSAIVLNPDYSNASRAIEELVRCEKAGYAPQLRQGNNIWDAILFKDNNLYRLFYLTGDSKAYPFWSVGEIRAAISIDMKKWEYIGVILKPNPDREWESGRMLAGSVYKENDLYYFFYSASPPKPLLLSEGIGIATSKDGISWQRFSSQIITLDTSDTGLYSYSIRDSFGGDKHFACRDPYIFKDSTDKNYYLFIVTSFKGKESRFRGCIGVAVSSQIDGEYKVLPPVLYPTIPETEEGIFYELERPQVMYKDGNYHLFFSCGTKLINPHWIKQVGREGITESSLYWYVSENITGPYVPTSAKPIVKGSDKTGLYATTLIEAPNGELIACGANLLTRTLEVSPRFPVRWKNGSIEIIVE